MLDLCSPDLRALLGLSETLPSTTIEDRLQGRAEEWQIAVAADKYRILTPVLLTQPGSSERAQAIRDLAAQPAHQVGGSWMPVKERTLYDWLNAAESDVSGLLPAPRSDRGQRRVRISRAWDAGCGLPAEVQDQIAGKVTLGARSVVYNDGASIREALRLAGKELCRLTAEAGSPLKPRKLQDICYLNSKWADRIGLNRYRLGYLAKKDHKRFQDQAVGRVKMALNDVPMDLVQGDVHYVDILVQDEGEPVRVRIIAWMDMASMFLWATVVLLSKGKGIIQADVAESLYDLASCPHGGVPKEFYLDNGGEYSALSSAMMRLAVLSSREFGLTLAKPYTPTSKGSIEGFFNILEGIFRGLPGWIGGRRDNKKSANKGKVVAPYSKGLDQLVADIHACVAIYNSREQSAGSRIAGMSPKEVYEIKALASGFRPRHFSELAFDLTFSTSETKIVNQSAVTIGGRDFHGDYLHGLMPGERVEVLLPLRRGVDHAWINVPGGDPQPINAAPVFAYGDRTGAKYQAMLEGKSKQAVAAMGRDIDPDISLFDLQKRNADMVPPQVGEAEVWEPRSIDKTLLPLTVGEARAREDEEARADIEEYLSMKRAGRREAGGCNHQASLNAT